MTILQNSHVSINVNSLGAELSSILDLKTKKELLWQGNPSVWGRKSPVLFPIVGKLKDNTYTYKGQSYSLPQHGFARDSEFTLVEATNQKIVFSLESTPETLLKYPFNFKLEISYELIDSTITVRYKVLNIGNSNSFFSIGAHPGFTCPLDENEAYDDYYLSFSEPETLSLHVLENGLISTQTIPYLKSEKEIPLSYELFKNDALVFRDYVSESISLVHKTKGPIWKFHFKGYPFLGIWSKPGPFVCIEPWQGIADFTKHNGDFTKKTGVHSLKPNESFTCEWGITVL